MSLFAVGYADWPLIVLHFSQRQIVRLSLLPSLYAGGMGAEAVASLILGKLYDKYGISVVIVVTLFTAGYGPLVFLRTGLPTVIFGTIVWGFGMAAQDAMVKAVITIMVPAEHRASAYGLFDQFRSRLVRWEYHSRSFVRSVVSTSRHISDGSSARRHTVPLPHPLD